LRRAGAVRCLVVIAFAGALLCGAVPIGAGPDGPYLGYLVSAEDTGPEGAELAARAVRAAGGRVVEEYREIGVVLAYSGAPDFGARLRGARGIAAAGADRTAAVAAEPAAHAADAAAPTRAEGVDDTGIPLVPDPHERPSWNLAMVGARPAPPAPPSALSHVVVAVLDAGVDDTDPDLRAAVDPARSASCAGGVPDASPGAWRPDPAIPESGHGTHVAGMIAAARNGDGVVGIAPGARIAAVRLLGPEGQYYGENLVCGFLWAADHGARVINNSYFADPWKYNCPGDPDQRAIITAVGRAVGYAERRGALVVASAGNDGQDLDAPRTDDRSPNDHPAGSAPLNRTLGPDCIRLPGGLPGVLDVSAVDRTGGLATYSNWGVRQIGVAGPGGDPDSGAAGAVVSDWPGGHYAALAGTSMAAAGVSGVAAVYAALHPRADSSVLRALVERGAAAIDCPARSERLCPGAAYYGAGEVRLPR